MGAAIFRTLPLTAGIVCVEGTKVRAAKRVAQNVPEVGLARGGAVVKGARVIAQKARGAPRGVGTAQTAELEGMGGVAARPKLTAPIAA